MNLQLHNQNIRSIGAVLPQGDTDKPPLEADFLFMKLIPLSQGGKHAGKFFAKVDDNIYKFLIQWKWCATKAHNTWYAKRTENKKSIMMHRVILGITDPDILIDHADHDGLNNQGYNIRKATLSQNAANKTASGYSNYLGVTYEKDRNKWRACVSINGKNTKIGRFNTETEAALAFNEAAKIHHGKFANLNKI